MSICCYDLNLTRFSFVFEHYNTRYEDALVSLMSEILHKMQFRFNQSQLEEMDDDALDDNVSSFIP